MKNILFLSALLFSSLQAFSQQINYEQKAFDFFRDSIIKHKNKKIYVKTEVQKWNYMNEACLQQFNLKSKDTVNVTKIASKKISLYGNKKVKEVIGRDLSVVNKTIYVNPTYKFSADQYISSITQRRGPSFTQYIIEMDEAGKISDWCEYVYESSYSNNLKSYIKSN